MSGDVVPRLLVAARFTPPFPLEQVFFSGIAPLANRIMRIGVSEFFESDLEFGDYDEESDECFFARHGIIDNVNDQMTRVFRQVDYVQRTKNVTCTVKPKCLAMVEGKCLLFSNEAKKKKKKKKSKRL